MGGSRTRGMNVVLPRIPVNKFHVEHRMYDESQMFHVEHPLGFYGVGRLFSTMVSSLCSASISGCVASNASGGNSAGVSPALRNRKKCPWGLTNPSRIINACDSIRTALIVNTSCDS